jgi:hypothetical protein
MGHYRAAGLRIRFAVAALLVALAAPSTLHAACRGEKTAREAGTKVRPWFERDRIFIGDVAVRIGEAAPGDTSAACPAPEGPPFLPCQVDTPPIPRPDRSLPSYPETLLQVNLPGSVRVQYVVDTTGRPDPRTMVAHPSHVLLRISVLNALPTWRFVPAVLDGRKVPVRMEEAFVFDSPFGAPPVPMRAFHDTTPDGVPRTTLRRPLRDSAAAKRLTAIDLVEAQLSGIATLIGERAELTQSHADGSAPTVCISMLHADSAQDASVAGLRRLTTLAAGVIGISVCPRTYASMVQVKDSLGRVVHPPAGWIDPYRIEVAKVEGWSGDAVSIKADVAQGTGGHRYLCGVERIDRAWRATCRYEAWWVH